MNTPTSAEAKAKETISQVQDSIAEDAQALMDATANVAGEKVAEARKRLSAALESGRKLLETSKVKAAEVAKIADKTVREHPYQVIAAALGVGAVLGFLLARRNSS